MTFAATLLLSVLPQVFPGGDLKLPLRPEPVENKEVRPVEEIERFRRDLLELQGAQIKIDQKLQQMGQDYPEIEPLILQVARTARATEMRHLMPVARRYGGAAGSTRVADELMFQLLARPLGDATHSVVETMAVLKGADAKTALQQCVRGSIPIVRRCAVEVLAPLVTIDDVPFAMSLSREQSLDLRLRGVDLLRAIGNDAANARLVELLSKDPALAAAACLALIGVGTPAVPLLQQCTREPAVDRSFLYAAFALAQIGLASGEMLLPEELIAPLTNSLTAPESLTRCLAAVPLADLLYATSPAGDATGGVRPDQQLVDALLAVVEPGAFVPNLDLLRSPSELRLLRHTGRVLVSGEQLSWREWWRDQRDTFLGVRARVVVDEQSAGSAIVTLRQDQRTIRIIGEAMADVPVVGSVEVLLTAEQMLALVREMEAAGFGDAALLRVDSALPRVRSLQLQVPGGRTNVAVTEQPQLIFDALAAMVQRCVDRELWQLYRVAENEPNRAAFWRAERRWLDAHPDQLECSRRFLQRVLDGWGGWSRELQARAIGYLAGHPARKQLLREQDGELALAALRRVKELGEFDLQLLELAVTVPGDRVWRECVAFAVRVDGGGRDAVRKIFSVLGPDAVLSALSDADAIVRRAAVDEVVTVRDQRSAPRLIELLGDADPDVQLAAAFACGQLQIGEASRPLVELIAAETPVEPELRRQALRSLGRVGGELAFPVLQQAVTAPLPEDKEAALRGLGELRDPRAAFLLAEFLVVGSGTDLGELARYNLQRQGAALAVPAVRGQLPLVQDEEIKAQLVLLLGLYQDPTNVPDLMDLLRQERHAAEVVTPLECTTGADLSNVPDRIAAIELWWRDHKSEQQWQWLLVGLQAAGVDTSLRPEHFGAEADMAPVTELARLLVELEEPRLWVLSAAVLSTVARQSFGAVTVQSSREMRAGIAARYREVAETARAAQQR